MALRPSCEGKPNFQAKGTDLDIVGESKYSTFIIKGVAVALVFHGAAAANSWIDFPFHHYYIIC